MASECTCPKCRLGRIPNNYTFGGYVAAGNGKSERAEYERLKAKFEGEKNG